MCAQPRSREGLRDVRDLIFMKIVSPHFFRQNFDDGDEKSSFFLIFRNHEPRKRNFGLIDLSCVITVQKVKFTPLHKKFASS